MLYCSCAWLLVISVNCPLPAISDHLPPSLEYSVQRVDPNGIEWKCLIIIVALHVHNRGQVDIHTTVAADSPGDADALSIGVAGGSFVLAGGIDTVLEGTDLAFYVDEAAMTSNATGVL